MNSGGNQQERLIVGVREGVTDPSPASDIVKECLLHELSGELVGIYSAGGTMAATLAQIVKLAEEAVIA